MLSNTNASVTLRHLFVWHRQYKLSTTCSLGSIVVSVMDSHSCDRGSNPGQGKHIYVML